MFKLGIFFLNLIWWNKILQMINVVSRLLQSKSNYLFLALQSFQSVVDKLSILRTHDQYNAFVIEAKTVRSNFDIFTVVLEPTEFQKKKTKNMPLQIDENTKDISLSEKEKYRKIYFETLDMIGELNKRIN
jgi:hypothetical protein